MRLFKQLFFGIGFLLLVFMVGFMVWYLNSDRPSCTDGIKNGDEEGVDCGLLACGISCPPAVMDLVIRGAGVIKLSEGEYDLWAQVYNPNTLYGAADVYYDFILKDLSDQEIRKESKVFYVLPGQTKYLVVPAIKESVEINSVEVKIKQVNWQGYSELGVVVFPLVSQERQEDQGGSRFLGVLRNDSSFDFDNVEVRVVVKDIAGDVVAVNISPIFTFIAGSERHFVVSWPYSIPQFQNASVEIQADTNLFRNSNFLRIYGDDNQPFQKFY